MSYFYSLILIGIFPPATYAQEKVIEQRFITNTSLLSVLVGKKREQAVLSPMPQLNLGHGSELGRKILNHVDRSSHVDKMDYWTGINNFYLVPPQRCTFIAHREQPDNPKITEIQPNQWSIS